MVVSILEMGKEGVHIRYERRRGDDEQRSALYGWLGEHCLGEYGFVDGRGQSTIVTDFRDIRHAMAHLGA